MAAQQLKLHLDLGEGFMDRLKASMEEEFEIASRKWGFYPEAGERNKIYVHAFEQLRLRISSVANEQWTIGPIVNFNVAGGKGEVDLPSPEAEALRLCLVRGRDGWMVDQEPDEDSVTLQAFAGVFEAEIHAWARTAIFYSVGSYKN